MPGLFLPGISEKKTAFLPGISEKKTAFLMGISFHFQPFVFYQGFSISQEAPPKSPGSHGRKSIHGKIYLLEKIWLQSTLFFRVYMYVENNMCNFIANSCKMHYILSSYDLILCHSWVIFWMGIENRAVQVVEFSSRGYKIRKIFA